MTMVTVTAVEVLPVYGLCPLYVAVMLCGPSARAEVCSVAMPEAFTAGLPSTVTPSLNVTVPVGGVVPGDMLIVAVRVTGVPCTALVELAPIVVVVGVI